MTATLDIDIGNTRTKWRCGDEAGALPAPELPRPATDPRRVRVATVLGNRREIAAAVRKDFGVEAEFATTSACLAGVRCGYGDPRRLGVDRWLAAVAAWERTQHAVGVISAGTAVTVDLVDAEGRHQGGFIAPGLRLLPEALSRSTADVRLEAGAAPRLAPGTDTQQAVAAGTFLMLLAFVDAAIAEIRRRNAPPVAVFLTGGDGPLLAPHLANEASAAPTLVLDGLAIALP